MSYSTQGSEKSCFPKMYYSTSVRQTCKFYLGEHRRSCLSHFPRGIIQHVWLKGVELCQLICCKMSLDLLLVHHTEGQRLFSHLPIVNLLLHCALKDRTRNTRMYFSNASNNSLRKKARVRWCLLINPTALLISPGRGTCTQKQSYAVQTGRPWRYSGHHRRGSTKRQRWWPGWQQPDWSPESQPVLKWGTNDLWESARWQRDAKWDTHNRKPLTLKGPLPDVAGVIEFFCPLLPCGSAGGAIQAVVVNVPEPFAFTFTSMPQ